MKLNITFLLLVFGLFVGCTSLKERAAEHLNSGNYESAIKSYQDYLLRFPGDAEAELGLRLARIRHIDGNCCKFGCFGWRET
jgi:hypothetical protein